MPPSPTASAPPAPTARCRSTSLQLRDPVKVRASFDRHNLFYEVRAKRDWETQLIEFLRERPGQSGIIYRTTRKSVEATAALLNNNGIGTHKLETYGDQFLGAIRQYLEDKPGTESERIPMEAAPAKPATSIKRVLGETYQVTLALLREGKSIEEVAAIRGIVATTVEGHIARLIEEGETFDWKNYVPDEAETLLRALFEQHGTGALSPIIEAADDAASYGQARILRAVIDKEAQT